MKIISTNLGETRTIWYQNKMVKTGIFKFPVDESIFIGKEDVRKDNVVDRKYHGGIDKACYLYSADHYKYWQAKYPGIEMPWGTFGENLTVEGLSENDIHIGSIFKIGNATVQVTQPRQPCFKLQFRIDDQDIIRKFIDSGYPGVYVRVINEGKVQKGDSMELVEKKEGLSAQRIFELLYTKEFQKAELEKAINDPFIAESCRKDLLKKWKKEL